MSEENIYVAVRVRPALDRERSNPQYYHSTAVSDTAQEIVLQEVISVEDTPSAPLNPLVIGNHGFAFDHVFDCSTHQEEVYEHCRDVVSSILSGYNGSIIAYGQTGTGKSYTLGNLGGEDTISCGIIPRCLQELFSALDDSYEVSVSYLQIYNEVVSDLLAPGRSLSLRSQKGGGVGVEGRSASVVRTVKEALALLSHGNSHRCTAQTKLNDVSSRSHAVFSLTVTRTDYHQATIGKLNIVDLAGSERVRLTGASGQRLEEGKKINQSLSALGNVVSALVEDKSHIPFRDSKLTRILEDSLGGNCKTVLLVTISPANECFAESLSTLKFASRARGLKARPSINSTCSSVGCACRGQIEALRLELEKEKQKREQLEEILSTRSGEGRATGTEDLERILRKQREVLQTLTHRFSSSSADDQVKAAVLTGLDIPPMVRGISSSTSYQEDTVSTGSTQSGPVKGGELLKDIASLRDTLKARSSPSALLGRMRSLDQLVAARRQELENMRRTSER